jgi:hypothetical protein
LLKRSFSLSGKKIPDSARKLVNYSLELIINVALNYFHLVISNGRQAGEILKISHIRSK